MSDKIVGYLILIANPLHNNSTASYCFILSLSLSLFPSHSPFSLLLSSQSLSISELRSLIPSSKNSHSIFHRSPNIINLSPTHITQIFLFCPNDANHTNNGRISSSMNFTVLSPNSQPTKEKWCEHFQLCDSDSHCTTKALKDYSL